jgi:hypothetical protein
MNEDDLDYFIRRANEERQRADQCPDPAVAQIHRELATHYENALASLHRDRDYTFTN